MGTAAGWPGLRYSEALACRTGASEYLIPGHPQGAGAHAAVFRGMGEAGRACSAAGGARVHRDQRVHRPASLCRVGRGRFGISGTIDPARAHAARRGSAEERQGFSDVSSMPRGCYEPWGIFRKPLLPKMKVSDCLKEFQTGGLRRLPNGKPFVARRQTDKRRGRASNPWRGVNPSPV